MPVTLWDLSMIVIVNGAIQLTGLVVMLVVFVRGYREITRLGHETTRLVRATAGLVYQESEKTRARIDEALDRFSR